ncbi:integrating conjugative element protein [Erwinia psidii]|uniref:integrating conjugative element protein n=1 Tax=Erwinia psidii TaxID=69224 RepID=UPI00226B4638|nr:integrating conjugative element protein [Erwinia psidii]MCX8967305.1 integrating conjugative element protein [Erwinia psidii]
MLKMVIPALLLSLSAPSHAALTEIADLGGESTEPLFNAIAPPPMEGDIASAQAAPLETAVFPVVSGRLHPGTVMPRPLSLPGMTPLFIIGDDPLSVRWLVERRKILKSLNATGLVVNVASEVRLNVLYQQADGLTLLPVSGDDLAQRLQLDAYPLLLTDSGLSQ